MDYQLLKSNRYTDITKSLGYYSRVGKSNIRPVGHNNRRDEVKCQLLQRGHGRIPLVKVRYKDSVNVDLKVVKRRLRR